MSPIHTPRLVITPRRDDDFIHFFEMTSDAETVHFIRPPDTMETLLERMARVDQYAAQHPGFGSLRINFHHDDRFIGNAIVRHADFDPSREVEIGYMIHKSFWGQGIATELVAALSDYVLNTLHRDKVIAYIHPEHYASQRVLEKNGFKKIGEEIIYGDTCVLLEKLKHETP
jgi:[ribosomal protein S5]-alanine N-acetyltransferase